MRILFSMRHPGVLRNFASTLEALAARIGDGYANVRFEARPENVKRLDMWSWNENPFKGTNEFAGLVVMMGLLNNWDLKDTNNKIVYVPGADASSGELRYVISDLGATLGKTAGKDAVDQKPTYVSMIMQQCSTLRS